MQTLTEIIMKAGSPWDNPFQGEDKKVLFVCSAGILRSATGARIYAKKYNTRACGSEDYALIPITPDLIAWADQIVFVNKENFSSVNRKFPGVSEKSFKVLDIPDVFPHMHQGLIDAFVRQYEPLE